MKATKKPVEIDYHPYNGDNSLTQKWVSDMGDNFEEWFNFSDYNSYHGKLHVKTLEGTSYEVTTNDVIIRGVSGEYYPCKKDIFEKTYDYENSDS